MERHGMRKLDSIRSAVLHLTMGIPLLFPVLAYGQFQNPTGEELQMTADPKAPGADAVILNREEKADDALKYHSLYVRIKVLTEKGKELATVRIPYDRNSTAVEAIQGRTIHADGTKIQLNVKPSDLMAVKQGDVQVNEIVFTLPSVEVGSILEYYLQVRYGQKQSADTVWISQPYWELQQPYLVRKSHYSYIPLPRMLDVLLYSSVLPAGAKVVPVVGGRFTVDLVDIPATPNEEYMPPLGSSIFHVKFYYKESINMEQYWAQAGDSWSKEVEHFAGQSQGVKAAVATLISPGDSEDVRAHKIYDAVMALENTDHTRHKSAAEMKQLHLKFARNADAVWSQKSGTSDELALLYLAMVRAAGLKAYAMTVCNRNQTTFDPHSLEIDQFSDNLVLVSIDGAETPVDPGAKFAAFGELDWKHTLASAIRQSQKGTEFATTPSNSYKDAATVQSADLTMEPSGSFKGTVRITMTGPAALRWRQKATESDESEVKKQFNEQLRGLVPDGVEAELDHFTGLDDYHAKLVAFAIVSGNMGTQTGKRIILPGLFFESHARHPFVETEKRQTPVDMHYAETVRDDVKYHLPESLKVESAPADSSIPWAGHAVFGLKAVPGKDGITVARSLVRGFAILEAKDYSTLRDFYQKVATADQQQLVLTTAPVVKGE
jgi:hypothetical protein